MKRLIHYLTTFDPAIELVSNWLYWPTVALMVVVIVTLIVQIMRPL